MVRSLLVRGMLAGLLAGLLATGFARLVGEPPVDRAIAFEAARHAQAGDADEPELVSRAVQSTVGLLTGVVVYGTALGGLFALAYAGAYGRIGGRMGRLPPRAVAALLAAAGFVVLVVVPQLKYPANPPSVGEPETIGLRTALYFGLLAVSVLAACAAAGTGRALRARLGAWNAALVAAAAYLLCMVAAGFVLAPVNEVPPGFPADLLWRFRLASLGTEAVLWTTLGLVFGLLAERLTATRPFRALPARL